MVSSDYLLKVEIYDCTPTLKSFLPELCWENSLFFACFWPIIWINWNLHSPELSFLHLSCVLKSHKKCFTVKQQKCFITHTLYLVSYWNPRLSQEILMYLCLQGLQKHCVSLCLCWYNFHSGCIILNCFIYKTFIGTLYIYIYIYIYK